MKTIYFVKQHPDAITPQKANLTDAGFDLYSIEDVVLQPLERKLIDTGIQILLKKSKLENETDDCLYMADVRPRSGNSIKLGLAVLNSPGTIDEEYTGNIKVIAYNTNKDDSIHISKGFKIAQLIIHKIPNFKFVELQNGSEDLSLYQRGNKGFGSSDSKNN